jgi:AGCS family alanine or glycine:cation symporter
MSFADVISKIDDFVWGPVMLVLLVGTGIFLTIRLKFRPWRNLKYALKSTLSKEARTTKRGTGDVSPFSALTTALAATIGTGNIVGVATAMVAGGPGALVWMWISALFGLTSKFSECMLAIKYREVNEKGEMSGGPMYTMKKGFKHKKVGAVLGMAFAIFAVIASFGIGNMTQGNSIATALNSTFNIPTVVAGILLTILALVIIVGGIKSISKVSSVVVPVMAIFYVIAGLIVIALNIQNVPSGMVSIFKMAFNPQSAAGGFAGTVTASVINTMRYGVARGVFSNEAGMGSAAITAAAATTDDPVRQGYINMTGTFWDTIVVCTITGLCIASSGVLGITDNTVSGKYTVDENNSAIVVQLDESGYDKVINYKYELDTNNSKMVLHYVDDDNKEQTLNLTYSDKNKEETPTSYEGIWTSENKNEYVLGYEQNDTNAYIKNGEDEYIKKANVYEENDVVQGSPLTIAAFETALGRVGAWLVTIGIALFAFSTILGWEYHGEKAFEYILNTHKYNMAYRIIFSLVVFIGATTALDVVWNFSDIANALMAIPNLICLLVMSGVVAKEVERFQPIIREEKKRKKIK